MVVIFLKRNTFFYVVLYIKYIYMLVGPTSVFIFILLLVNLASLYQHFFHNLMNNDAVYIILKAI